ncbi:hypothetical protein BDV11DRAFT_167530 [Aspergillus similis]
MDRAIIGHTSGLSSMLIALFASLIMLLLTTECMRQVLISIDNGMRRRRQREVLTDLAGNVDGNVDVDIEVVLRLPADSRGLHGDGYQGGNWNGRGRVRVGTIPGI